MPFCALNELAELLIASFPEIPQPTCSAVTVSLGQQGFVAGGRGIRKDCPEAPSVPSLTSKEESWLRRTLVAFGSLAWCHVLVKEELFCMWCCFQSIACRVCISSNGSGWAESTFLHLVLQLGSCTWEVAGGLSVLWTNT